MITGKVGSADVMSIASIYLLSSSSSCSYPGLTIAFLGGVTQRSIMLRRPGAPPPPQYECCYFLDYVFLILNTISCFLQSVESGGVNTAVEKERAA